MEHADRVRALEERLTAIAVRLTAVERRLGVDCPTQPAPPAAPEELERAFAVAVEPEPDDLDEDERAFELGTFAAQDVSRLEQTVGARVFALAGAVVVIAAAGLFMKLAWDRGWFNLLPDGVKVGVSAVFGALLLGAGEWARRTINAHAAAGLSAAGVGVLYATAYAAHGHFGLVGPAGGFAALLSATVIGIVVSARARLASVAVVSIVGGYAAPFLLDAIDPHPATLPVHWLLLLTVGLVLSGSRGGWFTSLRALVWWGTLLFGASWVLLQGQEHPVLTVLFLGSAWALIHAELIVSARAGRLSAQVGLMQYVASDGPRRAFRPVGASLTPSAWATALGAVVLDQVYGLNWIAPAAGFAATALLAIPLVGHLRALRDAPQTDLERLGVVLVVQAGALLFATAAAALAGWLEIAAWLGLAVASIVAGRALGSRGFDVYGLIVLGVATVGVLAMNWWTQPALTAATPFGLIITQGGVLAMLTGGAWISAACIVRANSGDVWNGVRAGAPLGFLLLSVSVAHEDVHVPAVSVLTLALAVIALQWRRAAPWAGFGAASMTTLGVSAIAWILAYRPIDWHEWSGGFMAHPGMWLALAIATTGLLIGAGQLRRAEADSPVSAMGKLVIGSAVLFAFGATSLEISRSAGLVVTDQTIRRVAVSFWWSALGVASIWLGFRRRAAMVRHTGMGLLALATAKGVVFDLASVSPELRVVSFLVLGLLLLGVGVAYARVTSRFADESDKYEAA